MKCMNIIENSSKEIFSIPNWSTAFCFSFFYYEYPRNLNISMKVKLRMTKFLKILVCMSRLFCCSQHFSKQNAHFQINFNITPYRSVQQVIQVLFQNQDSLILFPSFFKEFCNPEVRINKTANKLSVYIAY